MAQAVRVLGLEEMVALAEVERMVVEVEQVALGILLQLLLHREIMAVRVERIPAT